MSTTSTATDMAAWKARVTADERAAMAERAKLRREIAATRADIDAGRRPRPVRVPGHLPPVVDWWPTGWGRSRSILAITWAVVDRQRTRRWVAVTGWVALAVLTLATVVAARLVTAAVTAAVRMLSWPVAAVVLRRRERQWAVWQVAMAAQSTDPNAWMSAPALAYRPPVRMVWIVVAVVVCALLWVLFMAAVIQHGATKVADQRAREAVTVTAGGNQP
jgi:hypothetical protein